MTKVSLYTVTLILMGFLSLSSSARPIGNQARRADSKSGPDNEWSEKWTGDWKSTSSSDNDHNAWSNYADSGTPPNVAATGASNYFSDEFASATPTAKLNAPSGLCSLPGNTPRSSSPTDSAPSGDFSPPASTPTPSYNANDPTPSQADGGCSRLPPSGIPGTLGSSGCDPSGHLSDGVERTESSGLSKSQFSSGTTSGLSSLKSQAPSSQNDGHFGSLAPNATTNKQGTTSITAPSGASITVESVNRVAASLKRGSSGKATWYNPGLGSCGETDSDSDLIVALATSSMAGGKNCNKGIKITDSKTGKSATAKVHDTCPSCATGDLDMSPALFRKFQSLDVGKFDVKWSFE